VPHSKGRGFVEISSQGAAEASQRGLSPRIPRLLAFDGRVPHSVSKVRGTRDPRRGRLVLTGWFSQPRPSAVGGLADLEGSPNADALAVVESATNDAYSAFEALEVGRVVGFVALRLSVNSDGSVASVEALCDTLRSDNSEFTFPVLDEEGAGFDSADGAVRMILRDAFLEAVFPAAAATVITLPMSFE